MPTFAPDPDDDFSYNHRDNFPAYVMVSALRRAMGNLIAQSLPESPNPTLRVYKAMGQVLAQQINQRTALSASLAVNRLAAIQRPAMASAGERLPGIVSSSFSPLVEVQARVVRDALLGNQWQRTMLSLYPALRARKALESISRLPISGFGGTQYPPRPAFRPYNPWSLPEDPELAETEISKRSDTEIVGDPFATLEGVETYIRDAAWGIYWFVYKHHIVIGVALVAVGELVVPVLIAIYL